uniref:acyl-CoA desaturase n=1 Tax=Cysteiniphilum litorale TaxID=2056700 RepID=UPI003F8819F9
YKDLKNLDWSKVVWRNVILFVVLHSYTVYGLYLVFSGQTNWRTIPFSIFLYWLAGLGITMGAHRLWAHKSYKATFPVRFVLMLMQTLAFQNSIYEWSRDHRVHHKYTETDGDPHNAKRGFFFAHMGWLMYRKHPDVIKGGKALDFSDLMEDPIVKWQRNNYLWMVFLVCFAVPTFIPYYFWNESFVTALMVAGFMRYTLVLHFTWTVNSLAHYVGARPYDKTMYASENPLVAYLALGEGWHNFHHVFPYDYRAAEFGGVNVNNVTTGIIEFFNRLGQTYDLKAASNSLIERRIQRTGDQTMRRYYSKK